MEEENLHYKPVKEVDNHISELYKDMDYCQSLRDQPYHYFDDETADDYWSESVKRFNSYLAKTKSDNRRHNVFMPETQNQILAILSFVAQQRMRIDLSARTKDKVDDKQLAVTLLTMYDYFMDANKGDQVFLLVALEALIKGTAYLFNGWDRQIRKVKTVTKFNVETGKIEYEEEERVEVDHCISKLLPTEDVYIPNFYEIDIQKQPYLIIKEYVPYEIAKSRYEKYPEFKYVRTKEQINPKTEGQEFFYEQWASRTDEGYVELLHHYRKDTDTYSILANGVLLTDLDNPFLFDHKDYPLSVLRYQFMAVNFFYGKSFAQKVLSEQDAINMLYNMMLDRTALSSMALFISSINNEIQEDSIGPLQIVHMPDPTNFREAKFTPIGSGEMQMMTTIKESMFKSGVNPAMQGEVSNATATALLQSRQSAIQMMGLFINNLGWMVYDQSKQWLSNIIQFNTKPNSIFQDSTTKEITLHDQVLSDGVKGIKIVKIVNNADNVTQYKTAKGRELMKQVEDSRQPGNTPFEVMYITTNQLKNIDYRIKIVPTSSIPETEALRKAQGMEYVNNMFNYFGDMLNKEQLFIFINELFHQNPEQMKLQQQPQQQQLIAGPQGEQEVPSNSAITQQLAGTKTPSVKDLLQLPKQ